LFKQPPGMNSFGPWIGPGGSYDVLFKMLQALGVRYVLLYGPFNEAEERKFAGRTFPPRQPPNSPGQWQLYQLSDPNVGNYSPTELFWPVPPQRSSPILPVLTLTSAAGSS